MAIADLVRRRRNAGGFSLLEAMIAMTVLAFGLLTLAAMQLQALSQGAAGRHTADAGEIGQTYLEQIQRLPWTELDAAQGAGTWTAPAWIGAVSTVNKTVRTPAGGPDSLEHSYNIQWRVTDVLVAGNPDPCLRNVELRVSWGEKDRSTPKTFDLKTRRYNWGGASC